MSLQSDIMTSLASLGENKVWPQAVPEDIPPPFVVYRVVNKSPLTTLDDSEDTINTIISFESYGADYDAALTLAGQVQTAIETSGLVYYKTTSPGEDYIPLIDGYVEPLFFGFWHV
jgi:hypothetical protein